MKPYKKLFLKQYRGAFGTPKIANIQSSLGSLKWLGLCLLLASIRPLMSAVTCTNLVDKNERN